MKTVGVPAIIFLLTSAAAGAADYKLPYGNESLRPSILEKPPAERKDPRDLARFLAVTGDNATKLAFATAGQVGYRKMLKAVEDARLDKQTAAPPSAEGTTSLVSKGAATDLLALAVDQGALARSDNKSIATFSGNALGVGRFLFGYEPLPYCAVFDFGCPLQSRLENLSFSFSIDTSPGSPPPSKTAGNMNNAVLKGSPTKLAGWTVRYDFNVRRAIPAADFIKQVQGAAGAAEVAMKADTLFGKLLASQDYREKWLPRYEQELQKPQAVLLPDGSPSDGLKAILTQALVDLVAIARKNDPDFDKNNEAFVVALGTYFGDRDRAVQSLVSRVSVSLEYDNEHPLNQPTQSTAKLIVSARLDDAGKHQFTFNGSATRYDQAPPQGAVRRLRDAQAALQLDIAMTPDSSRVGASLSAGYYFQWMADNALLSIPSGDLAPGTAIPLPGDASVLLGTKGTISIGQIEVTFTFKNGLKLPLALSYANRTDLLKASGVRGHFGLSYDLESLFTGN
jgi:hypothetical protein